MCMKGAGPMWATLTASRRPRRWWAMTQLFEPAADGALRLYATPLGVDFCAALIEGLEGRLAGQPPEAIARVEILVANARMLRRLQSLYLARGPGFLPRLRTVAGLSEASDLAGLEPAMPPLRLRLKLADLVRRLIDRDPELAPRSAIYPLADSLADLMGEMFEERVTPEAIAGLDMGAQSGHWARSQAVLGVVEEFFGGDAALTAEARQARLVDRLTRQWADAPPDHPVLIAGSTGSRGATARLMDAVSRLPHGAVVLPGLDRDMPASVWTQLTEGRRRPGLGGEDHPQYRLARVAGAAGLSPAAIPDWAPSFAPASAARNRLVSLALRPAPVTDQWREEGPRLKGLSEALRTVTYLEAPNPQTEATAIALGLREAAENGTRAALVSPDRNLTRQVAAALDRWNITPDDSAGEPLGLTAGAVPADGGRGIDRSADLRGAGRASVPSALPQRRGSRRSSAVCPRIRAEGAARQGRQPHARQPACLGRHGVASGPGQRSGMGRLGGRDASGPAHAGSAVLRRPRRGPCRDGRGACGRSGAGGVGRALREGCRRSRAHADRRPDVRGICWRAHVRARLRRFLHRARRRPRGAFRPSPARADPDLGHAGGARAGGGSSDPRGAERRHLARRTRPGPVVEPVASRCGGAAPARPGDRPLGP